MGHARLVMLTGRLDIARFRIDDSSAAPNAPHKLRVLFLETGKILLRFPRPDAVAGEHEVHLFKSALVRFGIQRPDDEYAEDVDATENIECFLVEAVEDAWEEEHTPPIANGPADHAPGIAFGTNLEGENLCRVEPWYREPSSSEDGRVKEDEECGGTADLRAAAAVACIHGSSGKTAGDEHADALAGGAPVESPAATDSIQGEDTNERGKHVCDVVDTADPETIRGTDTSYSEDLRPINGNTGNTDPFLQNLKPDYKLHASSRVQSARSNAEEHVEIALLVGGFLFQVANADDFLQFSLGQLALPTLTSSKTLQNEPSLIFPTDFNEPARGLWHESDSDE